ncbi:MAG: zinc-binding dehydrogenase [Candidatus Hydrogenedens sp.]|nr:zinc-binding dehydrogenase [Candidatus Hydrogenedens sp.]
MLQVREAPDPVAKAGELRIRVANAGINFADIQARMGQYPDAPPIPCVVGYEVSGTVDQVGASVTGFKEGDRVVSLTRFGGYSDVVTVLPEWAQVMPEHLPFETCAAIPVNYATAWIMLVRQGNLKAGETVLVHSAGGGVGIAALQIIKHFGARAIGTASKGKHARLKEMGYEHCIDYRTEDFEQAVMDYTKGRGVDIVLDAQGGKSFRKSYQCLAPLGRLFLFGAASFSPDKKMNIFALVKGLLAMPRWGTLDLLDKNLGVFGTNMGHLWDQMKDLQPEFEKILQLAADGTFDPIVDSVFAFDQAAQAHDYIQDRKNFGKVLLKP